MTIDVRLKRKLDAIAAENNKTLADMAAINAARKPKNRQQRWDALHMATISTRLPIAVVSRFVAHAAAHDQTVYARLRWLILGDLKANERRTPPADSTRDAIATTPRRRR